MKTIKHNDKEKRCGFCGGLGLAEYYVDTKANGLNGLPIRCTLPCHICRGSGIEMSMNNENT